MYFGKDGKDGKEKRKYHEIINEKTLPKSLPKLYDGKGGALF